MALLFGSTWIVNSVVFFAILATGYVYVWRKGALNWH